MTEDKKFFKYPKIERLGSDENKDILLFDEDIVVVEEKVDGGNGAFWLSEDGTVFEQSRNRNLITDEDEKTFCKQRGFLREKLKEKELNPDYIYYLEWMQRHTICYITAPDVIGFDIMLKHSMNNETGLFLGRETKEKEFERLGIENIPLLFHGTVKELKKKEIETLIVKSKYYDGLVEGIVIKNYVRKNFYGRQLFAKLVRGEFKECNKAVFGNVRNKNSDTARIYEEYFTIARIKKMMNYLTIEEGLPLELSLMAHLPTRVIKDVLKEEFSGIYEKYKFIDFKELKNRVMKVCLAEIREAMTKRALND